MASLPDRDASSTSPLEPRTTTSSSSHRFSIASSKTGEPRRPASQHNGPRDNDGLPNDRDSDAVLVDADKPIKDGRGSHRSHRKDRSSGGFLLSNATFEKPGADLREGTKAGAIESLLHKRHSMKEKDTSKGMLSSPKKIGKMRSSYSGPGVGGSPLATNVATVGNGPAGIQAESTRVETQDHEPPARTANTALDVDSAQIVNLALNLSESRRNAQRRIISTPLPPFVGPGETGGSLRQHLQQQRRVSRTVSPKPDRAAERTMAATSRLVSASRLNSPLHASFDNRAEAPYQYHFSASTLARAEKAKTAIELMAQYRRLLQYVTPLKPEGAEKAASSTGMAPGSPVLGASPAVDSIRSSVRALGRPYNPLQYIRNRKVRARNSKTIDGEALGFGDLEKVTAWVDAVSRHASSEGNQTGHCLALPQFSMAADDAASPLGSPHSSQGKGHGGPVKVKRPRIDWLISPANMIADVFWLEQDDNKKLIEDSHGRRIFPQTSDCTKTISHTGGNSELQSFASPKAKAQELGMDLTLDTKLPEFKSVKLDSERVPDLSTSRARKKFREARAAVRLHRGSSREGRHIRSSRSRSESSDSDDSDYIPRRRRHNDSVENIEQGKEILEKQMMDLLAREAQDSQRNSHDKERRKTLISQSVSKDTNRTSANGSWGHSRSSSSARERKESLHAGSSGRPSLEVPGMNDRRSTEGWTVGSRPTSPSRRPLSRMKSKILPFIDRNRELKQFLDDDTTLVNSIEYDLETPDRRRRSMSPTKKLISRTTGDSQKSVGKAGSIRKFKGEESGIRGLFRNARNPVSRVSDLLRKKDSSPGSGFSTDESDFEEVRSPKGIQSRESSVGKRPKNSEEFSPRVEKSSYISNVPPLPVFTSPSEQRGRPTRMKSYESFQAAPNTLTRQPLLREERQKLGTGRSIDNTPRIDVHNASPSPCPDNRVGSKTRRDSSISDVDSNYSDCVNRADARLNSILGIPGKRRNELPITGLSNLETYHDRRPLLDRQWSISDRSPPECRGPMTRREIARVRALLLSSGIKAKEISRRAAELKDLTSESEPPYVHIAKLAHAPIDAVPKSQQHRLAARIISDDVQLSSKIWQDSADAFINTTAPLLVSRISTLQHCLVDNLTPATRAAADEADEVSKDLVTVRLLGVKRIGDKIDKMARMRRRRFRWARRGGWVVVEWLLVGVMWYVWFMVVIARVVMGIGKGIVGGVRWLFWL